MTAGGQFKKKYISSQLWIVAESPHLISKMNTLESSVVPHVLPLDLHDPPLAAIFVKVDTFQVNV